MPNAPANPKSPPPHGFDPGAGVLALLLPGLGYFALGERKRGVLLASGILFMVALGLLIGGLDAVDRVQDRWWFLPQAGLGPLAWAIDWARVQWGGSQSIGRVNEIGTLFVVIAGMCNAVAIIDCLLPNLRDEDGGAGS